MSHQDLTEEAFSFTDFFWEGPRTEELRWWLEIQGLTLSGLSC